MVGNNELMLNEASLLEAVQLLLDRDMPGAGKAVSVKANSDGYKGSTFAIGLTKQDELKVAQS